MQVIIGCLVIGAIVLIGSFFKAFQISGRENDDQQQAAPEKVEESSKAHETADEKISIEDFSVDI